MSSEYRLRADGRIVTDAQFRLMYPAVTDPDPVPTAVLDAYQADMIYPTSPPAVQPGQSAIRNGAIEIDGLWRYNWMVISMPTATLDSILSNAISSLTVKIDHDVDVLYSKVIGNRESEYTLAEKEATEFKAANYQGDVPISVKAWSDATGQTPQWAADNIIATAIQWRNVQGTVRAARLGYKQSIAKAQEITAVIAVSNEWSLFLNTVKTQLGLNY